MAEQATAPRQCWRRGRTFTTRIWSSNAEGHIVMHFAQPDSGTNHGTSMSIQVAEILGYTNLDHIRLIWGDSELAPSAPAGTAA